jgi:hypothetical protein
VSVNTISANAFAEFAYGVAQQRALVREGLGPVAGEDRFVAQRKQSGRPTAVASRGAKTAHRFLEHRDSKFWVAPFQLARRPQSRITSTDDRDVNVEVAGE